VESIKERQEAVAGLKVGRPCILPLILIVLQDKSELYRGLLLHHPVKQGYKLFAFQSVPLLDINSLTFGISFWTNISSTSHGILSSFEINLNTCYICLVLWFN